MQLRQYVQFKPDLKRAKIHIIKCDRLRRNTDGVILLVKVYLLEIILELFEVFYDGRELQNLPILPIGKLLIPRYVIAQIIE